MGLLDTCVHPVTPRSEDLNRYLAPAFRREMLNAPGGGIYLVPVDEHVKGSYPDDGSRPGSSPELVARDVLEKGGADFAILLPLTRGLVADQRFEMAIAAATNQWMAETWLGEYNQHGRFKGSIRVSPRTPQDAVDEIERWAGHPHFVQVAVPLESPAAAYGDQMYFDIWKAAAEHGLPVAVHADRAGGVLPPPTPQGYPQYFIEEYSQQPIYSMIQLCSLIGHGVFDRLPNLVFVFADGGFDYAVTLTWRLDKEFRAARSEVPWITQRPTLYFPQHVRFIVHRSEGSEDPAAWSEMVELAGIAPVLMYGSNYPSWDYLDPVAFESTLSDALRGPIMSENARSLYGLPATVSKG
jgi:predicted TIM-barrel fold metal-dependent hydrolase